MDLFNKIEKEKNLLPNAHASSNLESPRGGRSVTGANFIRAAFFMPWKYSFNKNIECLKECFQLGIEVGEVVDSSFCTLLIIVTKYLMGQSLSNISQSIQAALSFNERFTSEHNDIIKFLESSTQYLQYNKEHILEQTRENINNIENRKSKFEISCLYISHAKFFYICGLFDESLMVAKSGEKYLKYPLGFALSPEGYFYHVLSLAALYTQANKEQQRSSLKKIKIFHKKFERWASWCPENWLQYERLLAAEIARIKNEKTAAMDFYDEAILAAQENENLLLMGIANECAGRFYLDLDKPRIAKTYLQDSHYAYTQWGALAKTAQLEQQYPDFFQGNAETASLVSQGTAHMSMTGSLASIDILALFKSTQAISSEIRLDHLLQKLLVVVLQNAGAQRGMLLMEENNAWFVKAEGTAQTQHITVAQEGNITHRQDLPFSLINYALRTQEEVLIQDAKDLERYLAEDAYLAQEKPESILILPISYQGQIRTLLYLENKTTSHAFTPEHLQTLELLSSQVAISLENARLYYQATHDPLTGLANRNLLYQMFTHASSRAKREHKLNCSPKSRTLSSVF